jgi:hypothetical protein
VPARPLGASTATTAGSSFQRRAVAAILHGALGIVVAAAAATTSPVAAGRTEPPCLRSGTTPGLHTPCGEVRQCLHDTSEGGFLLLPAELIQGQALDAAELDQSSQPLVSLCGAPDRESGCAFAEGEIALLEDERVDGLEAYIYFGRFLLVIVVTSTSVSQVHPSHKSTGGYGRNTHLDQQRHAQLATAQGGGAHEGAGVGGLATHALLCSGFSHRNHHQAAG